MSTDPRSRYPGPDQQEPEQQAHPGHGDAMSPEPDYGEDSYRGSGKLTGRRALITGGDSGIGRAVALAFAREGADVMISHLATEVDDARETCRLVRDAGRTAAAVPGDIQDEAHCNQLVERCVDELGGLDILVNNAACQMSRIWTPLIPATMPPGKVGEFGADTPLGRAGQPAELAPAYVFLASDDSTYITGERIGATGGRPLP
jgi:NAD(P)-dependent dehydrogenase (short-subunit alcohol dehydrogenase family)